MNTPAQVLLEKGERKPGSGRDPIPAAPDRPQKFFREPGPPIPQLHWPAHLAHRVLVDSSGNRTHLGDGKTESPFLTATMTSS